MSITQGSIAGYTNVQRKKEFEATHGVQQDADGNYVPKPGGKAEYEGRFWQKANDEAAAGSRPKAKISSPDARDLASERRGQLKQLQNERRKSLVDGGYSWAEDHMRPEQKEKYMQDQKIAAQEKEMNALKGQMGASATDSAILDFAKNGDADVFQQAIRNDPNLRQAWREQGVEMVSNVNFEHDTQLLDSVGLTKEYLSDPEILELAKKNIFKVYDGDKFTLSSVGQLSAEVGTGGRVTSKTLGQMTELVAGWNMALNGKSMELETMKAHTEKLNAETAVNQLNQDKNVGDDNQEYRTDALEQKATNDAATIKVNEEQNRLRAKELAQKIKEWGTELKDGFPISPKERENELVARTEDAIYAMAGGEEEFYKLDFSDPDVYDQYTRSIEELENIKSFKMDKDEKKKLEVMNNLLHLSKSAGKISENSVGWWDATKENLGKYTFNDIKGLKASISHKWFRNSWLRLVAGLQMTPGEIQNYKEAAGTLHQQFLPVLQAFAVQLGQLENQSETVGKNMGRLIGHAKTSGMSIGIAKIKEAVEQRISTALGEAKKVSDAAITADAAGDAPIENEEALNILFGEAPK